jgi:hypothetical protein
VVEIDMASLSSRVVATLPPTAGGRGRGSSLVVSPDGQHLAMVDALFAPGGGSRAGQPAPVSARLVVVDIPTGEARVLREPFVYAAPASAPTNGRTSLATVAWRDNQSLYVISGDAAEGGRGPVTPPTLGTVDLATGTLTRLIRLPADAYAELVPGSDVSETVIVTTEGGARRWAGRFDEAAKALKIGPQRMGQFEVEPSGTGRGPAEVWVGGKRIEAVFDVSSPARVSPDGTRLLYVARENTLHCVDARTGADVVVGGIYSAGAYEWFAATDLVAAKVPPAPPAGFRPLTITPYTSPAATGAAE